MTKEIQKLEKKLERAKKKSQDQDTRKRIQRELFVLKHKKKFNIINKMADIIKGFGRGIGKLFKGASEGLLNAKEYDKAARYQQQQYQQPKPKSKPRKQKQPRVRYYSERKPYKYDDETDLGADLLPVV